MNERFLICVEFNIFIAFRILEEEKQSENVGKLHECNVG